MPARRPRLGILLPALLLFAAQGLSAQGGDPLRGAQVYREVCGICHLPDPRQDRPARAIGIDRGVLTALETIGAMRFLLARLSAQDIANVQAWLDTFDPRHIRDPRALNGNWFDPATSGQGFDFFVLPGDTFAFMFYGHRNDGRNLILTGVVNRRPRYGETFVIPVVTVTGGRFGLFDPAQIRRDPWGTLSLRFDSCERAAAVLDGRDGRQALDLVPLTRIEGLACD